MFRGHFIPFPGMHIADSVVLITGASEGIGAACADAFRDGGARVALVARSRDKLETVARGDALVIPGDLRDPSFRRECVQRTVAYYGRIDILVNNAGVGLYQPASNASPDEARALWELNFWAPLELTQMAVADMRARRRGAVVNVGSIAGKMTLPWFTLYSASKYALGSLTDGLRMELRRDGIHAMLVCPGYVATRFQQNVIGGSPPPGLAAMRGRWAVTPEQVAADLISGLERNARTVMSPRIGWLAVAASRLFPGLVEGRLETMYRANEPPR
jgi:short-subunit dehydrogenase